MASTQPLPTNNAPYAAEPAVSSSEQLVAEGNAETKVGDAASAGALEAAQLDEKEKELKETRDKWPGWPGFSVFRIVVPALKVGGIIGRKGDLVRKLVDETRARIRVLEGPLSSPDRIVLISGKEEPDAVLPPAVDAIMRIFKRVTGLVETDGDDKASPVGTAFCSMRLLVPSSQAISLIGKKGSLIKSIKESSGASARVLSNDELPIYADADERIVELQGETLKVLKALEAVVGHLRNFLVDQSILPLFEKKYNAPATQERQAEDWSDKPMTRATPPPSLVADYPVTMKRDSLFLERGSQIESQMLSSRLSLYGEDQGLVSRSSSRIGRSGGPFVTQVAHTMQIPVVYAVDIIGVQGATIDFIRRTSGAILTVQESRGLPEEITVEIKGTSLQVQTAQELIQEFTGCHRDPLEGRYGNLESSYRPLYLQSQLGRSSYSSSSFSAQPYTGGYRSSADGGGYGNFRM